MAYLVCSLIADVKCGSILIGIRAIVLYIACIMSFIWRTNAQDTQPLLVLSHSGLLLIRLLLSCVLGLGILYGSLVIRTFSHYGDAMDRDWKRRIDDWVQEKAHTFAQYPPPHPYYAPPAPMVGDPNDRVPHDRHEPFSNTSWYTPGPIFPPVSPLGSDVSDESNSSRVYATQSNTLRNKASNFRPEDDIAANFPGVKGPGYDYATHLNLLPLPRNASENSRFDPYDPRRAGLAVSLPPDLPPIPGSAVPPVRVSGPPLGDDGRTPSDGEYANHRHSFTTVEEEEEEEELENRVRFRSPLASAKASSFGGSDQDFGPSRPVSSDPSVGGALSVSLLKNILPKELYLRKIFLLLKDCLQVIYLVKIFLLLKNILLHTNRLLVVTLLPRILQFTRTPFLQRRRRGQI